MNVNQAFDVMCPPTEYRPIFHLGYITFQMYANRRGFYCFRSPALFQDRAWKAWPARSHNTHREY